MKLDLGITFDGTAINLPLKFKKIGGFEIQRAAWAEWNSKNPGGAA